MSKKGDYIQEPIVLILEQESVRIKQLKQLKEGGYITGDFQNVETKLPPYATYDARLKQFQGYVEFIHFFWGENSEGIEVAMQMVMGKTLYLLTLAKNYGYDEEHFGEKVNEFMQMCREAIEDFALSKEQKITILKILENSCLRIQGTPN